MRHGDATPMTVWRRTSPLVGSALFQPIWVDKNCWSDFHSAGGYGCALRICVVPSPPRPAAQCGGTASSPPQSCGRWASRCRRRWSGPWGTYRPSWPGGIIPDPHRCFQSNSCLCVLIVKSHCRIGASPLGNRCLLHLRRLGALLSVGPVDAEE